MSNGFRKGKTHPSIFRLARTDAAVRAEIDADEIRHVHPGLSEPQARAFVLLMQQTIAATMLAAGWSVVNALLEEYPHGEVDEDPDSTHYDA